MAFDVLYRHLRQLGYEVQYVRNFTDVDDKIIKRAAELGEEPSVLSQRYVCRLELKSQVVAMGLQQKQTLARLSLARSPPPSPAVGCHI